MAKAERKVLEYQVTHEHHKVKVIQRIIKDLEQVNMPFTVTIIAIASKILNVSECISSNNTRKEIENKLEKLFNLMYSKMILEFRFLLEWKEPCEGYSVNPAAYSVIYTFEGKNFPDIVSLMFHVKTFTSKEASNRATNITYREINRFHTSIRSYPCETEISRRLQISYLLKSIKKAKRYILMENIQVIVEVFNEGVQIL